MITASDIYKELRWGGLVGSIDALGPVPCKGMKLQVYQISPRYRMLYRDWFNLQGEAFTLNEDPR